jgi:hypothetical protein
MGSNADHPSVRAAKRRVDPEVEWRHVARLEPGVYKAYCRKAKIYLDGGFKRWVCGVQFDVLNDSQETRAPLTWFMNLGSGDKPRVTRRSKYWSAWIAANGGTPKRQDRMSSRVFERRYATVVVSDTTRDSRQELTAKELAYSVIRDVESWDTGGQAPKVADSLSHGVPTANREGL